MKYERNKWVTLYDALDTIYNPKGLNTTKKWIFDRALEDNMITYYAYSKAKKYFKEYWTHE